MHYAIFLKLALLSLLLGEAHAQQLETGPEQWEADIQSFLEADRLNPPPEGAVLFAGSSSIRLWQTLSQDFPAVPVINRGFGGSEIEDVTYYADRIVIPYSPRLIALYAGDNDLARGKTPERVFDDYKAFVRKVHQQLPAVQIAFISIKPSIARWHLISSIQAANEMIKSYASQDRRLAYIDVFTPMLGPAGTPRKELFVEDGLHLNHQGYALWKALVRPFIK